MTLHIDPPLNLDDALHHGRRWSVHDKPPAALVVSLVVHLDAALAEVEKARRQRATWESAALAGLLALGLDDDTAGRVRDRIRALAAVR